MTTPTRMPETSPELIHQPKKQSRRMVPLRYVLMPFAIILIAVFVLGVIGALAPKPAKKPIEIKAPLVEVQTLLKEDITLTVKSQGTVMPRTETSLVSEVSGRVINVAKQFNVGGFFRKGEQLLVIDPTDFQLAVQQAQARLETAQANLVEEQARTEQAKEEWLLSGKSTEEAPVMALRQPQMQKARADVKSAEAELEQAKVRLARTIITAPYDAIVKSKQADIGQYVTPGSVFATTFAVDYAEARLPIKQKDITFLNLPSIEANGSKSDVVTLSMFVGGEKLQWRSHIARYEGVVDESSRVHYVIAQIDNPYALGGKNNVQALHVGSFVEAQITGKTITDVIAIPRNAIYGANKIYQLTHDNKLAQTIVQGIYSDDKYLYTKQALDLGKPLIITKLEIPVEGMALRVKEPANVAQRNSVVTQGE